MVDYKIIDFCVKFTVYKIALWALKIQNTKTQTNYPYAQRPFFILFYCDYNAIIIYSIGNRFGNDFRTYYIAIHYPSLILLWFFYKRYDFWACVLVVVVPISLLFSLSLFLSLSHLILFSCVSCHSCSFAWSISPKPLFQPTRKISKTIDSAAI